MSILTFFFLFFCWVFYRHYMGDPWLTYICRSILPFFLWVFIGIIGRTPDKRIAVKVYFDFFFSGVFIGIIGRTPDKRISEGLFCLFFSCFWVFIGIIGGTPDKRISEGLFCLLFFYFLFFFVFFFFLWFL